MNKINILVISISICCLLLLLINGCSNQHKSSRIIWNSGPFSPIPTSTQAKTFALKEFRSAVKRGDAPNYIPKTSKITATWRSHVKAGTPQDEKADAEQFILWDVLIPFYLELEDTPNKIRIGNAHFILVYNEQDGNFTLHKSYISDIGIQTLY